MLPNAIFGCKILSAKISRAFSNYQGACSRISGSLSYYFHVDVIKKFPPWDIQAKGTLVMMILNQEQRVPLMW